MLGKVLWAVAGCVVGMVVAIALLIAVELFSAVVHPFPEGFGGTHEEIVAHVARYPHWVLAVAVPMWGVTAYLSTWAARRIGGFGAALVIGLLLVAGVLCNVSMLPYPIWFKVASVVMIVAAVVFAINVKFRRSTSGSAGEIG
jgi:hypothetical protein